MKTRIIALAALACILARPAAAYVDLPGAITHNMVLQQKSAAGLWGEAAPGSMVTITPSWNGKPYTVPADREGRWSVRIETPAAGGPYTIKFDDGEARTLRNVMVGEVWLCSGQSNMEMPMAGWGKVNDYQQEVQDADQPMIRILKVKKAISGRPQCDFVSASGGWQECSSSTVADNFSAAAYFFARNLREAFPEVAIGLVDATWGGTIVESWSSPEAMARVPDLADTLRRYAALPPDAPLKDPNKPSLLFNAMIHPLLAMAFRGVIWYQGESNNRRAWQYRTLFPAMIEDWRAQFAHPGMPFLYVQLANYMAVADQPGESSWAELREAQAMALRLPATGMAVAIDIGDANDIHPKNKQEVGRRLALLALAKVYHKDVICQGPVYKGCRVEGKKVVLSFDTKLEARDGGELKGFAVVGSDRVFHWAEAQIRGDKITVFSSKVPDPVAVRYGWANNPVCNLVNEAGLPASPFRTDDWPGITVNAK